MAFNHTKYENRIVKIQDPRSFAGLTYCSKYPFSRGESAAYQLDPLQRIVWVGLAFKPWLQNTLVKTLRWKESSVSKVLA